MKYLFSHILVLACLLLSTTVRAQFSKDSLSSKNSPSYSLNPGIGKQVFSTKHLIVFGGLLGTSFLIDEWTHDRIQANKSSVLTKYTNFTNEFGEKKIMGTAAFSTWLIGTAIKDERLSTTAFNSVKAMLCGALLTEGIKNISGRSRPYLNRGSMHFKPFSHADNDTKSFPSGHAFVAWSVITPFAEEYSRWLYAVPISVSFARMYKNKHWLSDVVLGGGIGYFAGLYFQKRKNQKIIFNGNGIVIKF